MKLQHAFVSPKAKKFKNNLNFYIVNDSIIKNINGDSLFSNSLRYFEISDQGAVILRKELWGYSFS